MSNAIRFIHTGDLHLGSTAKSIPADPEGSTSVLDALYVTLEQIIDDAIAREVDFVIFAGDIFDNAKTMPFAQIRFDAQMERLREAGIHAYLVYGNHDPFTEHPVPHRYPDNVHEFDFRAVEAKHHQGRRGTAKIYGRSYGYRAQPENLVRAFKRDPQAVNAIGILHTGMESAADAQYAPCTKADLAAANMDYWALGHFHKGGQVSEKPAIYYCSSPQALDIGEQGSHGYWYTELVDGHVLRQEWVESGVLDFATASVDVTLVTSVKELFDRVVQAIDSAVEQRAKNTVLRIEFTGERVLDERVWNELLTGALEEHIRARLVALSAHHRIKLWLDPKIIDNTILAIDIDHAVKQHEFIAKLVEIADDVDAEPLIKEDALRMLIRVLLEQERVL